MKITFHTYKFQCYTEYINYELQLTVLQTTVMTFIYFTLLHLDKSRGTVYFS